MKQIIIKEKGIIGREKAVAFCRKAKCQAIAYFRYSGIICKAEKLSKSSEVFITENVSAWCSGKKTVAQKFAEIA